MEKGFLKFKKRSRRAAWIKAMLWGISASAAVSATLVLLGKRAILPQNLLLFALIGVATLILSGGIALLCTLPSEKRLAKRLDRNLQLNEKVQTMIAFRDSEGDVVQMQRIDTDEILEGTPYKQARLNRWWVHFICPVLALALILSAIIVPKYVAPAPPPPEDPPFTLSAWQEQAVKDLIQYVKDSDMETTPKDATVTALEELIPALKAAEKQSQMKAAVIDAIRKFRTAIDEHNTYDLLADGFKASENQTVARLGIVIAAMNALALSDELQSIGSAEDGVLIGAIGSVAGSMNEALTALEAVPADNALRTELNALALLLTELASSANGKDAADTRLKLGGIVTPASERIAAAMQIQRTNETVGEYAVNKLIEIFGLSRADLPAELLPNRHQVKPEDGDYDSSDPDKESGVGGGGSGDMIYGSDDLIYDPEAGEYRPYGEVINSYYARISELILDGTLTEELEELLTEYYALLYNGADNKNPEN